MSKIKLNGKRVLITGATDGIGLHLALELRARGAELILVVRDPAKWTHGPATLIEADLGHAMAVEQISARADLPTVDVMINNAGGTTLGPVLDLSAERITEVLNLNLVNPALLSHAFLSSATAGAMLVNVTSIAGTMILPQNAVYGAAKAAMRALTRSLRFEVEARGVTVLDFCPGSVKSKFHQKAAGRANVSGALAIDAEVAAQRLANVITARRGGTCYPDWVARIVSALAWRVTDVLSGMMIQGDAHRRGAP